MARAGNRKSNLVLHWGRGSSLQTSRNQVGGIEDHIHVLVMAKPIHSPSEIAKWLKADSSKWIRTEFENIRTFGWQDGYGVFSVSKSSVPAVVEYIKNQRVHHQTETFEEEYERLMKLHEVDYDPKYLFD